MRRTSSVKQVRSELIDLIRSVTVGMGENGRDVVVTDAMNAHSRSADDVQIGDVRRWNQQITQLRGGDTRHKRDESYEIDINVYVVRQQPEESNEQVWVIWDEIDNLLATDPSIGLGGDFPTLVVGREREGYLNMTYDEASRGWRSRILMRVSVTNKI